ncbi:hypothetical protein Bca52824_035339 [Brassica carinata]|uniref:Uncharacterized protein n=1 Tax=Brassica carinata TaxID=52824 RepID=A0A8X7S2Y3_BRACI|nr:hypothetical protein Bca52824_035339 [Brassica carinata]
MRRCLIPEAMLWPHCIFITVLTLSLLLGQACFATDTLLQGQYLKDGQELVSAFNIFKLKFFNFENSSNPYLGNLESGVTCMARVHSETVLTLRNALWMETKKKKGKRIH